MRYFWLFIISLLASTAHAMSPTEFERFNLADYSDDQTNVTGITVISEDADGFMWVGGENGLAHFTGARAYIYRPGYNNPNTLISHYVRDLLFENDNTLWIATSGGLSRLDIAKNEFTHFTEASGHLPSDEVTSLLRHEHQLIVGTTSGLAVIDFTTLVSTYPPFVTNMRKGFNINAMAWQGNDLWLGSTQELGRVNVKTHQIRFYQYEPDNPQALPYRGSFDVFAQGETLWVASMQGGIYRFDLRTETFHKVPDDIRNKIGTSVVNLYGDEQHTLWVGTDNNGLWQLDTQTLALKHFPYDPASPGTIYNNKPRAMFTDSRKNFWVGTFGGTLNFHYAGLRSGKRLFADHPLQQGIANESVISLLETNNRLWVGTESGLSELSLTGEIKRNFTPNNTPYFRQASAALSLAAGSHDDIWIGTWAGGIYHFNPAENHWRKFNTQSELALASDYIWALYKDSNNQLWIGTHNNGLERMDLATQSLVHYPSEPDTQSGFPWEMVRDICEDTEGRLWFATFKGLARYRPATDDFARYLPNKDDPHAIKGEQLLSLHPHSDGRLWIGSRNKGISVFDPKTEQFKNISPTHGLPALTVNALFEDNNGDMWANTPSGIAHIDSKTLLVQRVYNKYNGLASNIYNRNAGKFLSNGLFALGGKEGLSIFHPDTLKTIHITPPPKVTSISINFAHNPDLTYQYVQAPEKSLSLNYKQNTVTFEFDLNNYFYPRLNQYQYRLRGFDDTWRTVTQVNSVYFTNLPAGSYTFEIRAKTANSIWGEAVTAVFFTIAPPPWRTTWAFSLYALIGLLLFAAGKKYHAVKTESRIYKKLSQVDTLTELPNRHAIQQTIRHWLDKNILFSVMVIDLDYFKRVNDQFGHDAGDCILTHFGQCANALLPPDYLLGRWGGEEFIVISRCCDQQALMKVADRLRAGIAEAPYNYHGTKISFTISVGTAIRQQNESFAKLFERADSALYHAKNSGRNQAHFAQMHEQKVEDENA